MADKMSNDDLARGIAGRVNELVDTVHTGQKLTAADILNVAQVLATDPDVVILFSGLMSNIKAAAAKQAIIEAMWPPG